MNAQQLRNSILQLAIQGKLVPQDPNDEPASVLLDRIRKQKEQLVKEGKLKPKDLVTTPVAEEDIPFDIPESWEWCKFGDIVATMMGKTPPRNDSNYWQNGVHNWVAISDMKDYGHIHNTKESVSEYAATHAFREKSKAGDLLMSFKLTVGRTSILEIPAYHNEAIITIRPYIDVDFAFRNFLFYLLPLIANMGESKDAIKGRTLNSTSIYNLPIPLPPLSEQRRIVAKLEELLPLVEQYGKAQDNLDALNADLPRRLRQSILQEAIQGKLVPQDPNDEPASVAIDKSLYTGKISTLEDVEYPFEIPSNWCFCRLQDVAATIGGYAFSSQELKDKGVRVIRISDVTPNGFSSKNIVRYNGELTLEQYQIKNKDILIAMTGGTVGKSYLVTNLTEKLLLNQRVAIVRAREHILPQYLSLLIQSPLTQDIINDHKNSTNDNISMVDIRSFLIPLPPLSEQRRIVAKLEQLLSQIDKLK